MHSLRMVYFYRNMSEYCLYYLRVSNIVHLVGKIKEYIDPKCMGGGGELKKMLRLRVACLLNYTKGAKLMSLRQQHRA